MVGSSQGKFRRTSLLYPAAALLACTAALAQPEISVLERRHFAIPTTSTHRLPITIVQIEGAGWTRERAIAAIREAATILAQCDVGIADVDWQSVTAPPRYLDFSTPVARELAKALPVRRPAMYLVRDTLSRPAFDAEAIGRGNSRTRPELADTVWITVGTPDLGIALAHELAHVLMDSGEHSADPGNLMRDETSAANTVLSAAQCERMRSTASKNRLLER